MAALGVVGQVVHLGYFTLNLAGADFPDRRAAAEFLVAADGTPFVLATFLPFFFFLLAPIVQAVGLRRAGVIQLWATIAITAATALTLAVGNAQWSNAVVTALLIAGFAPAAATVMARGTVGSPQDDGERVAAPA